MLKRATVFLLLVPHLVSGAGDEKLRLYFQSLSKLEFQRARLIASQESDNILRIELQQLSDILASAGQVARSNFNPVANANGDDVFTIIRALNEGYLSLFYDQYKGNAFTQFYAAYKRAKTNNFKTLEKASVLAMLRYFENEVALNSDLHLPYLQRFKEIQLDTIDHIWLTIYSAILYTKTVIKLDTAYFALGQDLRSCEALLATTSPVLSKLYFETALQNEIKGDLAEARKFYELSVEKAKRLNFLRNVRFSSYLKLMMITIKGGQFQEARHFLREAKGEIDLADTLRSNYYLNLFGSFLLNAANRNDSAYAMLKRAYAEDFYLDFRRNTLEINRRSVELETHEKELANLQLRQEENWLVGGIVVVGLTAAVVYLAYRNLSAKSRLQLQQREVRAMQLEKLLKEQQMAGIDQMVEAQEKERQRIANELHDHLGSHLATLKFYFEKIGSYRKSGENDDKLFSEAERLLDETYKNTRQLAHAKNAGLNSSEGLVLAVRDFAAKVSLANKLSISVEEHGMDTRLENAREILIFRIIQELITNVIKHSQATEATIHLTRHDESLNVMVEDNGVGFAPDRVKRAGTMGLHSIQARVENAGGIVTIDSILEKGTTVIIDIPIS